MVHVFNSSTSWLQRIMVLVREFTLHCLQFSIVFQACHVPGVDNSTDGLVQGFGTGDTGSARHPTIRSMESWRAQANRNMRSAVAPSTHRGYGVSCNEYFTFCEQEGLDHSWPTPDEQLIQLFVFCYRKGLVPR